MLNVLWILYAYDINLTFNYLTLLLFDYLWGIHMYIPWAKTFREGGTNEQIFILFHSTYFIIYQRRFTSANYYEIANFSRVVHYVLIRFVLPYRLTMDVPTENLQKMHTSRVNRQGLG